MELAHIKLQYYRLERHYINALKGGDPISFLDFAHSLRIWVDLKSNVDQIAREKNITFDFKNVVQDKQLKDMLKGTKYIYLPLASGVPSPNIEIRGFRISNRALTPEEIKKIAMSGPPKISKTDLTYCEWLGAGIYEVPSGDKEHPKLSISREIIIKRVANILGASHPEGAESNDSENKFDQYIKELHTIKIAGSYPATYYQLLEIAKDILDSIKAVIV